MIYQYVVSLRNEKRKFINAISQLLAGMSAVVFMIQQIRLGPEYFIFMISSLLITGGLIWNLYRSRKGKQVFYSRILLVAGVTWFSVAGAISWIGLPILLLSLLEKQVKLPLEIGFTDDRIVFNTLFKRKFTWHHFRNIILKDGLLTLDFKNNKLLQKQTIDDDVDADEDEFNAYCRHHLTQV